MDEEVFQFVADECGVPRERLTLDTRLLHDLRIDGADGTDLVERFAKRFGVEMTGFRNELHFGPEAGCNPVAYLWLRAFQSNKLQFVPITIGDLVEAATTRHWRNPSCGAC